MSGIVERNPAEKPLDHASGRDRLSRFPRKLAPGSAAIFLVIATAALGGEDDGPELAPPSEMSAVAKPAKAVRAPSAAPASPLVTGAGGRAVLAVPGLTTPRARHLSTTTPPNASLLEPSLSDLGLEAPIEMRGVPSSTRSGANSVPVRSPRPLVLESSTSDEPTPIDGSMTGSNTSTTSKRSTSNSRIAPQPSPMPSRRPRLFGFLPGATPPASSPAPVRAPASGRSTDGDTRDDPAVESALKRRIEKQASEAVGDRARSIEVRVVGKDAVVHVRGVKFYQKRAVRKSLEAIPALAGLRPTIQVFD